MKKKIVYHGCPPNFVKISREFVESTNIEAGLFSGFFLFVHVLLFFSVK